MKRLIVLMMIMIGINNKFIEIPFSSFSTAGKGFEGLPNEFPKLISLFEKLKESDHSRYEIIRTLEPIIGYLPPIEQYALYTSINTPTTSGALIFNQRDYEKIMNNQISSLNNLYPLDYEIESYKNYITNSSALLGSGMSCLQKVINKFGYDSPKNNDIIKQIYQQFDTILKQQAIFNKAEMNFLKVLFEIGVQRREYLFQIPNNLYSISISSSCTVCNFDRNNKKFYGFKYNSTQKEAIIKGFLDYINSKMLMNRVLNEGIMNIEKEIGSMIGCMNEKDNNLNAGKSSDGVDIPEINYHGKEIIGINNGNRIRNDGRTQNNFTLNHGFNLGKYSNTNFKISQKWINYLQEIQNTLNQNSLTDEYNFIKDEINELLSSNNKLIPEPNGYQKIILNYYSNENAKDLINQVKNEKNKLYITCSTTDTPSCNSQNTYPTPPPDSRVVVIVVYNSNGVKYILSKDKSTSIFDIDYNGSSLGKEYSDTVSACNGVFIGGGKDDKEACRGVLKKKCANEIDFRCKQTGLYDYLNQNPSFEVPDVCADTSSDECLRWIDHAFMLGGLIPKPSQFQTFSLTANSWKHFKTAQFNQLFGQNSFTTQNGDGPNFSLASTIDFSGSLTEEDLKNIMDKAFTSIVNSASFLNLSFCFFNILLFLL